MRARLIALLAVAVFTATAPASVIVSILNVSPAATNGGTSQPADQQTPALGSLPFTLDILNPTTSITPSTTPTDVSLFNYTPGTPTVTTPGNIVNAAVNNYDLSINLRDTALGNLGTIDLLGTGQGGYNDGSNRVFINDSFNSVNPLRVNGQVVSVLNANPFDPLDPVAQFSIPFGTGFLNFSIFDPNAGAFNSPTAGLNVQVSSSTNLPEFGLINAAPTAQRQPPGATAPNAVPEPASLAVLGLVAGGAALLRRRRERPVAG